MAIVVVGTLDTKGREVLYVKRRMESAGESVLVIDTGSGGFPTVEPDVSRDEVFEAGGSTVGEIQAAGDRGKAVACAAVGAAEVLKRLHAAGQVEGVLGLGGSAGTTIGATAMRGLPFGVPKLLISTLASGQTRPYLGGSDIVLMPSISDVAGLNRITRSILNRAADALVGMVRGMRVGGAMEAAGTGPVVGATMFGVTTPSVEAARARLEASGCEVLVFHATGVGGQAMESLVRDGEIDVVLDLTTTELADELVGGILTAGPERLEAAGAAGVPQVVSFGALDMVNFGPRETVPEKFAGRKFHIHNPTVTLMRTTVEENAALGGLMARKLARSRGPVVVLIPRGGVSAIDAPGKPFHDPAADAALFEGLIRGLEGCAGVEVIDRPEHINDPAFAELAAAHALRLAREGAERRAEETI
jgi:uncharacterized protein (UPF0261 family)